MRIIIAVGLALLLVGSVAAAGVLIKASSMESGLNDAAFYAYQEGRVGAAEQLYLMALEENPEYVTARYNLATLLFQQGRFGEAATHLETLVDMDPTNPHYHYDLAVNVIEAVRQQGESMASIEEGIRHYEEAERLSPGFAYAAENLEVLYDIQEQIIS